MHIFLQKFWWPDSPTVQQLRVDLRVGSRFKDVSQSQQNHGRTNVMWGCLHPVTQQPQEACRMTEWPLQWCPIRSLRICAVKLDPLDCEPSQGKSVDTSHWILWTAGQLTYHVYHVWAIGKKPWAVALLKLLWVFDEAARLSGEHVQL